MGYKTILSHPGGRIRNRAAIRPRRVTNPFKLRRNWAIQGWREGAPLSFESNVLQGWAGESKHDIDKVHFAARYVNNNNWGGSGGPDDVRAVQPSGAGSHSRSSMFRQHILVDRSFQSKAAPALVLGLVAGYLYFFALTLHGAGDEGLLLYPAERLLNGQVPYRDFFTELAPGTIYIQAALFKLFGIHFLSARLPLLLLMSVIGWQIYRLGRRILPAPVAALPVLIYVVTAFTRWMVVSHHWYSLCFALAAALLLVAHIEKPDKSRLFWAGAAISACGLCMQSKGAFVLLAAFLFVIVDGRWSNGKRRKFPVEPLGWFTAGALFLAAAPILYFCMQNALGDLAYSTFSYLWQSYLAYEAPLRWTRSRHGVTLGFELKRTQNSERDEGAGRGQMNFNGRYTGSGLADFMLGLPNQYTFTPEWGDRLSAQHVLFRACSGRLEDPGQPEPESWTALRVRIMAD